MPLPIAAGAAIAQGAIGLGQTVGGMIQAKKAREELEGLEQPFYKIQDELFQNRNLAAQQAQMGVPQATMDYLTAETQRGLGTSLSTLKQTGGSANNVAELFSAYQRGIQGNAAMDAQQRIANLGQFMKENQTLAGQKTMQWTINEFQPFQNKVQALQQRIAQGGQQMGAGISAALGGAASFGTAMQNQDLINSLGNLNRGVTPASPIINQAGLQQAMSQFRSMPQVQSPQMLALQGQMPINNSIPNQIDQDVYNSRMTNPAFNTYG